MDKELVKAAYIGALTIQKRAAHSDNVQALIDSGVIQQSDIDDRGWYNPTKWWDGLTSFGSRLGESAAAYLAPFQTGMSPQQYRETLEMSNKNRQYALRQGMANRLARAAAKDRADAKALDYRPNTAAGINSPEMQQKLQQAGYVKVDQPQQPASPAQSAQQPQTQQPTQNRNWATQQGQDFWKNRFANADARTRQQMLERLDQQANSLQGADRSQFQDIASQMRQYARSVTPPVSAGHHEVAPGIYAPDVATANRIMRQGGGTQVRQFNQPGQYMTPSQRRRAAEAGGGMGGSMNTSYYNGNNYRFAGGMTIKRPPIPYNPRWH